MSNMNTKSPMIKPTLQLCKAKQPPVTIPSTAKPSLLSSEQIITDIKNKFTKNSNRKSQSRLNYQLYDDNIEDQDCS